MQASFRPRARLLKLLGDQLIGTSQLAIFELVKNSYDADAEKVAITISNPNVPDKAQIEVIDFGGEGMDLDTVTNVWLEPGADHRQKMRLKGKRSKKHKRLPLGEKGVGRFAVHKLGQVIELTTRAKGEKELYLRIDWKQLDNCEYMEDANVEIIEKETPEVFFGKETGTKIVVSELNYNLGRGEVRRLYRNIQSIKSPFEFDKFKLENSASSFDVTLEVEGHPDWTEDLLELEAIIKQSLFSFSFLFDAGKWSWNYEFTPNEAMKKGLRIEGRELSVSDEFCEISNPSDRKKYLEGPKEFFNDLGPIFGEIYVFDFDSNLSGFVSEQGAVQTFLKENQGIRVYRDGIRVYNYGEPDNDWLEMDLRRVNRLAKGLNRRIVVGAIALDLEQTPRLVEKTNREGFVESESFLKLKSVIGSALGKLENLRLDDKNRLRAVSKGTPTASRAVFNNPIVDLKEIVAKHHMETELGPAIELVEKKYGEMEEIMLTAGLAGLNMSIAFHEIHHGISTARKSIEAGKDLRTILEQFDRFELLLDTYAGLLKQEKFREVTLAELLKSNVTLSDTRFLLHKILVSCPVLVGDEPNYSLKIPKNLLVGIVNNLIDNAIYWLDQRWGDNDKKKYLYVGVSENFDKGPAIIIADNGPGWREIDRLDMVKPFRTTKPGGMGIGLYFADTVMQMIGGELVLLEQGDIDGIPSNANGAIAALVFSEAKPCSS
ncbi:MAG: ATP-binding protein [Parvibaculaceae bacterium]|nr:ATP-binding protein [Parvibaculaceae bacterium]